MQYLTAPLYSIAPVVNSDDELASPSDFCIIEVRGILDKSHFLVKTRVYDGPSFLEIWSCSSPIFFDNIDDAEAALAIAKDPTVDDSELIDDN